MNHTHRPEAETQAASGDALPSMAELLLRHAQRAPDSLAYLDSLGGISYAALVGAMRRGAAWLHAQGVRAGDTAGFALDPSEAGARRALELFYAAAWLGAVVLPLYPDIPPMARVALLQRFKARWLLAGGAPPRVGEAQSLDPRGFDAADSALDAHPAPRGDRLEAPLLYVFTSGTTGSAKILLYGQGETTSKSRRSNASHGMDSTDRVLPPTAWPSSVGLRCLLRAHEAGAAFVCASPGESREEFGDLLARFGVTRVIASPWQVRRLLLTPPPAQPLPALRSLSIIGAMISESELESACAGLTPNIHVAYGCNELGPMALLYPGARAVEPGSVGRPLPGVEVRVEDEQGNTLSQGEVGRLFLRAPWMPAGYADNPAASAERFRGGWFYSGDLGGIAADGQLFLRGRAEDVINAGGLKIYPAEIEAVIRQHPGVLDAAVAGVPHPQAGQVPAAFVVARPVAFLRANEKEVIAFCRARLEASRVPFAVLFVAAIPRNVAGKILRDELVASHPYAAELARGLVPAAEGQGAAAPDSRAGESPAVAQAGAASPHIMQPETGPSASVAGGDGDPPGVVAPLLRHALSAPDSPAYLDSLGALSYGELAAAMRRGAAWLAARGVRAGDTVALNLDPRPAEARRDVALFYACAWLGAAVLPLYHDMPSAACVALLERFKARWLLADGAPAGAGGAQLLDIGGFDAADAGLDALPAPRGDRPQAPLLYVYTSGTTGNAKVMLSRQGEISLKARASNASLGIGPSDRVMPAVPWPSGVAARYLLRAHQAGAAFVCDFIGESREAFGATLARHGVTCAFASPWQVRRLLLTPPPAVPLPALRSLSIAGAAISQAELEAVRAGLTPHAHVDYGSNETGPVALLRPGVAPSEPGSVGHLLPGVELRIEDEAGNQLPQGRVGRLAVRTPWLAAGYSGNAGAAGERFRDSWFHPGDLGGIAADGQLFLRGRSEEVINYGGLKIWPEEIEAVLKMHPALADAAVAGLPDPLSGQVPAAFIVSHHYFTPEGLREHCAAHLEADRIPLHFILIDAIPRNANGKILREQLIATYGPVIGAGARGRTGARDDPAPKAATTSNAEEPALAPAPASTIVGALERHAASQPEQAAYIDELGEVSYGELWTAARRGAAWLARAGVRPGETVALSFEPGAAGARRGLALWYAIAHAGAALLPLYADVPQATCIALIERYQAHWLLVSGAPAQVAGTRTLDPRDFDAADTGLDAPPAPRGDAPDADLIYVFTSGTTAHPKALLFSQSQFFGNTLAGASSIGMRPGDRVMAAVAWPSMVGLRTLHRAHTGGAAFVAAPFDDTRQALAATLARFGINRLYASPWQVRRLLQSTPHALPPLASLHVTGAFIADEELAAVRAVLTQNVYVGYGSNEVGVVTLLQPGDAPGSGVGRLVEGVEGRVTDAGGRVLPAGEYGDLAVRAPWMCTRYARNAQASGERFRDGWFYPGDTGCITQAGYVILRGRTGDVLNHGGLKIWPEDVESVLKQHPALADAAVCGLPDPMAGQIPVAFIVSHHYFSEQSIRDHCADHLEAVRIPVHIVAVDAIPRNTAGKVMREQLIASYGAMIRARMRGVI